MNWAVFPWCYFLWNNTSVVFGHFLVFHTRLESAEHSSQSLILPMKCFSAEFCELYLFLFFLFFSLILFHYSIYTSICWVFSTVWRKPLSVCRRGGKWCWQLSLSSPPLGLHTLPPELMSPTELMSGLALITICNKNHIYVCLFFDIFKHITRDQISAILERARPWASNELMPPLGFWGNVTP